MPVTFLGHVSNKAGPACRSRRRGCGRGGRRSRLFGTQHRGLGAAGNADVRDLANTQNLPRDPTHQGMISSLSICSKSDGPLDAQHSISQSVWERVKRI